MIINQTQSLEDVYQDLHIREVNVEEKCDFKDFLSPNENPSMGLGEHLNRSQPGIIVSTGTERSFFNLLLCPDTCEGIVIRDINPRVKAYVDFNAALIRISDTCEEYNEWSQPLFESQINQKIKKICAKIMHVKMPQEIKDYYLQNARAFGEIYWSADKEWRSQEKFKECHYHQNNSKFLKIKHYINAGNLISTIGNINDLKFIKDRKIAVVDTSNICDYSLLDLQGGENFYPRVIMTQLELFGKTTKFFSYVHSPFDENTRKTFDDLVSKIRYAWRCCSDDAQLDTFPIWMNKQLRKLVKCDDFTQNVGVVYSFNTLQGLKIFIDNNLLEVFPDDPFPIYIYSKNLERINYLHANDLDNLCRSEEIKRFLPYMINYSHLFKPHVNLAFSTIEEWKVAFENLFSSPNVNLKSFLENLDEGKVLEKFAQNFGEERLAKLQEQNETAKKIQKEYYLNKRRNNVKISVK